MESYRVLSLTKMRPLGRGPDRLSARSHPVRTRRVDEPSDAVLAARLCGTSAEDASSAFNVLFERYYAILCSFAARYLESEEVAEDIVQDAFLLLWARRRDDAPGPRPMAADHVRRLLYVTIRNSAVSALRHTRVVHLSAATLRAIAPTPAPSDALLATNDLADAVQRAVALLPRRCREVLILHRERGLSYREIGAMLGITEKTVEVHMGRAFKLLRKMLDGYRG
jgi:RNA polymerase sigma-70 factor (ECF subfamily)